MIVNKKKFEEYMNKKTSTELGDRRTYIGSSDISGCLRKAFLEKFNPQPKTVEEMIVLQRGHMAEKVVEIFLKDKPYIPQFTVEKVYKGVKLKAHIDFLINEPDRLVVVECKSTSSRLNSPYDSWIRQVHYQMAMLSKTTDKPIEACIIAMDLNSGWIEEFPVSFNEEIKQDVVNRVKIMAYSMSNMVEPPAEVQLYCSKCPFKNSCPKLLENIFDAPKEIASLVEEIAELNKSKKELEAKKKIVLEFMENSAVGSLKAGKNMVKLQGGTEYFSLDAKRLKEEQPLIYYEYAVKSKRSKYLKII